MKLIQNQTFDAERALYGEKELHLNNCTFDGPADGESALKECENIQVENCRFHLRYPFWHDSGLKVIGSELTPLCRAALWYDNRVEIKNSKLHGIKALRECSDVAISGCDICSAEFGWSVRNLQMHHCTAESEYFLMRSENMRLSHVRLKGKYSFQYIKNAVFEDCEFDTKDAFWHAENVTVKNSVIKGEYLGWYSNGLTLDHCKIIGTQPLCYCKNLTLLDCEMSGTDLCFEKSQVNAPIKTPVDSIKNPLSGTICVPSVSEIIMDDENARGKIIVDKAVFDSPTAKSPSPLCCAQ